MNPINRVLIAGAGAVGLTVADALFVYDPRCVAILARGERLDRYRRDGLFVNHRPIPFAFADFSADNPYDLIIVACKFHHLDSLIPDMKPFVGPDTHILSLINGIQSEDILGAAFGRERLPLAMILGTDAQHNGNAVTYSHFGKIHFGDEKGRNSDSPGRDRDRRIAEFFTRASIPSVYHEDDMRRAFWYKYMINVGANQVSAVLRLPYGPFKKNSPRAVPEASALVESAMSEVIALARAEGISLDAGDIKGWDEAVSVLDDGGYTSMCQDVLARRKTELEMFAPVIMELGKKHGIPTPVNEVLFRAIRTIEQTY